MASTAWSELALELRKYDLASGNASESARALRMLMNWLRESSFYSRRQRPLSTLRFQRLFLKRTHCTAAFGGSCASLFLAPGEELVGILRAFAAASAAGFVAGTLARGPAGDARPHFPGRAVAGHGIFLEIGDFCVVHAVEIVVRLVVLPDMVNAEMEKLAIMAAALGRAMGPWLFAALPLARRLALACGALGSFGLASGRDADFVEVLGRGFHREQFAGW